jgi:hypothetical protein
MRLPRPRLTIRRLLIAVAFLGLTLGLLAERHHRFDRLAAYHADRKSAYPAPWLPRSASPSLVNSVGDMISIERHRWHAFLEAKYDRHARYPWLPVAPDPPEAE